MADKLSHEELQVIAQQLSDWAESDDFYESMKNAIARRATAADKQKASELANSIKRGRPDIHMPRKGFSPTIQFRVPRELQDLLAERSEKENKTQSEIAREALAQYLLAS